PDVIVRRLSERHSGCLCRHPLRVDRWISLHRSPLDQGVETASPQRLARIDKLSCSRQTDLRIGAEADRPRAAITNTVSKKPARGSRRTDLQPKAAADAVALRALTWLHQRFDLKRGQPTLLASHVSGPPVPGAWSGPVWGGTPPARRPARQHRAAIAAERSPQQRILARRQRQRRVGLTFWSDVQHVAMLHLVPANGARNPNTTAYGSRPCRRPTSE